MKYFHRKNGTPVRAVQFTDKKSVDKIHKEFNCQTAYFSSCDYMEADGIRIEKGQYAVRAFPAIVAIDQDKFDERYKKDERQMELF